MFICVYILCVYCDDVHGFFFCRIKYFSLVREELNEALENLITESFNGPTS